MLHPLCNKISSRIGAFIVGLVNFVIGLTGMLLIFLDIEGRKKILSPQANLQYAYDAQKDSFQFFLEYWLPSLSLLLVGLLVILSAVTKRTFLATLAFVLSTVQLAGLLAGFFALIISGVDRVGVLPFFVITLTQFYFHWIVAHFTQFAWAFEVLPDTQELIDPSNKIVHQK